MNKKTQLQFVHRTAILLESGISLGEALEITARLASKKARIKIHEIKRSVDKGTSLSRSIAGVGIKFDPTLLSMISFGENSGILAVSMRQAISMNEKSGAIKRKIIGALVYPTFIAVATLGMTLFLVLYIFPKIIPLFSSMNIELPLLTRWVKGLYELLAAQGVLLIIIIILSLFIFIFIYKKKTSFRYLVQHTLLRTPFLGSVIKKYFISSICRSLASLLECGQTLPHILLKLSESTTSEVYRRALKKVESETRRGLQISVSMKSFPKIIPVIVPDMLSIGERTGSLSSMCDHVSRMYEEEIDIFCRQIGTMIEPVLMIGMGLVVGSVALSIILPIYEVTNHLTR